MRAKTAVLRTRLKREALRPFPKFQGEGHPIHVDSVFYMTAIRLNTQSDRSMRLTV
jgi:hypothetical protein